MLILRPFFYFWRRHHSLGSRGGDDRLLWLVQWSRNELRCWWRVNGILLNQSISVCMWRGGETCSGHEPEFDKEVHFLLFKVVDHEFVVLESRGATMTRTDTLNRVVSLRRFRFCLCLFSFGLLREAKQQGNSLKPGVT